MSLARGLQREAHRQAEQAGLGRGVVGLADVAGLADDRADVDDAAGPAVQHVLQDRPRQVEGAGQVDLDDVVPVLRGHLPDGLVQGDARVVDQDVEAAVPVEDLLDHPLAVFGDADVALVQAGARVVGDELLGGLLAVRVARGDLDTAGGEPLADRPPDAPDTPGDQCDLAGHVSHAAQSSLQAFVWRVSGRRAGEGPRPGRRRRRGRRRRDHRRGGRARGPGAARSGRRRRRPGGPWRSRRR